MPVETPPGDELGRAVVDRVQEGRIPGGDPIGEALLEDVAVRDGVVTFTVDLGRLDRSNQLCGAGLVTDGIVRVRLEAAERAPARPNSPGRRRRASRDRRPRPGSGRLPRDPAVRTGRTRTRP